MSTFPHGYAVLVGVGASAYPPLSLPVTVKDVEALQAVLIEPARCGFPDSQLQLLHDASATRAAILAALDWLKEQAAKDPEATVIVYYSGHGWLDATSGRYALIPHDIDPFDLATSALSAEVFADALRQIKPKRLLVILDCCHAQGMATAKEPPFKLPKGLEEAPRRRNLSRR